MRGPVRLHIVHQLRHVQVEKRAQTIRRQSVGSQTLLFPMYLSTKQARYLLRRKNAIPHGLGVVFFATRYAHAFARKKQS